MKKVIKIFTGLLIIGASLFADSSSGKNKWNNGSIDIETSLNNVYIYDKKNYLLKNQNQYEMEAGLRDSIYKKPNLCKLVNTKPAIFVYIYSDGALTITIDGCK